MCRGRSGRDLPTVTTCSCYHHWKENTPTSGTPVLQFYDIEILKFMLVRFKIRYVLFEVADRTGGEGPMVDGA